jgi:hypothetical protein
MKKKALRLKSDATWWLLAVRELRSEVLRGTLVLAPVQFIIGCGELGIDL